MFNQITILGVGLLGASLAMGIRKHNLSKKIKLWARRKETLGNCKKEDWCDECEENIVKSVAGSDLIVVCTPVESIPEILNLIAPELQKDTIVTDVGSVKSLICNSAEECFENSLGFFIGSHPMAGSEKSGMTHASRNLFVGKTCVLTPLKSVPQIVQSKMQEFWEKLMMRTVIFSPEEHDKVVAYCSHLPHLVSTALAKTLHSLSDDFLAVSGNGLRDTTRIAEGDPDLWRQIVFMNQENISCAIEEFEFTIKQIKKSLINDSDELYSILSKGADFRKRIQQDA